MRWNRSNTRYAGWALALFAAMIGAVPWTAPSLASAQEQRHERLPVLERDWTRLDAATVDGEDVSRSGHGH